MKLKLALFSLLSLFALPVFADTGIIVYFIYFVAVLVIINLLLGMAGHPIVTFR